MSPRKETCIVKLDKVNSKKTRIDEDDDWRPWSELPGELLDLILKHLGIVEFLLFACVCRSWRACAAACKQEFMANQPPLIFLMSSHAKRSCYFYNIFDGRLYRRTLPNLVGKACTGFSCGYLIMEDKAVHQSHKQIRNSELFLVNPFTGHELHFPSPPQPYSSVVLTSCNTPYPQFVLIAISARFFLQFRRYGDDNWSVIDYRCERESWVEDVAVFKGKAYVITNDAKIGILNLNSSEPHVTMLEVGGKIPRRRFLHHQELVASDKRLFMVDSQHSKDFKVFMLDFSVNKWKKVGSLGRHALFLGGWRCCGLSTPSKMRGKFNLKNCICYLEIGACYGYFHSLDGRITKRFSNRSRTGKPDISIGTQLWYFPHLSFNVDSILE